MRKPLRSAAAALVLVLLCGAIPGAGAGEQLSIEAFYGNFQGSGIARTDASDYFGLTLRDFDVTVRPHGAGIEISWTTVLRQGGDPNNPNVRRKSSTVVFVPSDLPGVYRAAESGDALAGQPLAWAYVKGYTLTVHSLAVLEGGDYVMQTYNRTLSDMGMALEFISIENGETARRVEGRLTKRSD
ncbi:MAG: hypothetical protein QF449_13390 [Alphaproteobacteria bacterium]|jgi:hypothetical protein|nr:hypothetical protein [Alphaproteobacteria bacterium]MDP6590665.1 hypothetical protein [Alphaproteobacteria bacterium]MDP6819018.1 hypothetical protein [Alphaproteobacteria bacterium]|tara:strand:+ start:634 stop:1188 length:555 start_codon:yes stop_codon:yes gene_type:complete